VQTQKWPSKCNSLSHKQINSDKMEGNVRNPFAFYFLILRGFSGSCQTLPSLLASIIKWQLPRI